jgi:Tat protein translocase TatB subunit
MDFLSHVGISELLLILLLALLVVGPERLPEVGKKLGQTLRSVRKAYDNLTRDLGPELASLQQTTRELRESMDTVRSIPQDMVQTVVKAADLDETMGEIKGISQSIGQMGQTLSTAQRVITNPVGAAVSTARDVLNPSKPIEPAEQAKPEDNGTEKTQPDTIPAHEDQAELQAPESESVPGEQADE